MTIKKKITKAEYIDRFIDKMKKINRDFDYDQTEEWAYNAWTQHSREDFRHLDDKSPEKNAEEEMCWALLPTLEQEDWGDY